MYKTTIAIDLDGVLNNYTKYEEDKIPQIKQGAREFIEKLYNNDYELILYTTRKPMLATKWLIENKLDMYFSDVTNVKPLAKIYLDDRAIRFENDYNKAFDDISNLKR